MSPATLNLEVLLAVDIGQSNTRALLFDVVDGAYRFVAAGSAPTTAGAPYRNVQEGVRMALDRLQQITGRQFIGAGERIIVPSASDGSGVDAIALVLSAGAPLKLLVVGLLEDISVESATRLARTTYSRLVGSFHLNDRRSPEARLDAILRLQPDLVLVAGGTDGGATQSVAQLIEPLRLACSLLPEDLRPAVLYAGNPALGEGIKEALKHAPLVETAPNIRPSLELEQLEPAQVQLGRVFRQLRLRQMHGLDELDALAGGNLMPHASAFGRIVRFLGMDDPTKGVLGIDLGASAATLAASFDQHLTLNVYPEYGLSSGVFAFLQSGLLAQVMRWLPADVPESEVRDYLHNKTLFPEMLPVTPESLAMEQALARVMLRQTLRRSWDGIHKTANLTPAGRVTPPGLLPPVEPIIAAGSVLTRAPHPGQSLLMLLDALQPTGITTVILDVNNLTAALGAVASINPTLAVQVLDSGTFPTLGTVVNVVSQARPGTPVLRATLTYKDTGDEVKLEVKQGTLEVLPLPPGKPASLHLKPYQRADIGMGPGRGGNLKRINGGALGVVIDARGRPLELPEDADRRREAFKKWNWTLGG